MDALTVYHGRSMEGYRTTLNLRADSASTEELREAMIRSRAMFEDLTGLHEGHGEPARDRVAAIRDRAADRNTVADRNAVADNEPHTTAAAEPVTADPVAEDRDLAARDEERAAENASRTAYPPR